LLLSRPCHHLPLTTPLTMLRARLGGPAWSPGHLPPGSPGDLAHQATWPPPARNATNSAGHSLAILGTLWLRKIPGLRARLGHPPPGNLAHRATTSLTTPLTLLRARLGGRPGHHLPPGNPATCHPAHRAGLAHLATWPPGDLAHLVTRHHLPGTPLTTPLTLLRARLAGRPGHHLPLGSPGRLDHLRLVTTWRPGQSTPLTTPLTLPRARLGHLVTRLTGPPATRRLGSPGRPGHHLATTCPGTPLTLSGIPRLTTGEHATHPAARRAWRAT